MLKNLTKKELVLVVAGIKKQATKDAKTAEKTLSDVLDKADVAVSNLRDENLTLRERHILEIAGLNDSVHTQMARLMTAQAELASKDKEISYLRGLYCNATENHAPRDHIGGFEGDRGYGEFVE